MLCDLDSKKAWRQHRKDQADTIRAMRIAERTIRTRIDSESLAESEKEVAFSAFVVVACICIGIVLVFFGK